MKKEVFSCMYSHTYAKNPRDGFDFILTNRALWELLRSTHRTEAHVTAGAHSKGAHTIVTHKACILRDNDPHKVAYGVPTDRTPRRAPRTCHAQTQVVARRHGEVARL